MTTAAVVIVSGGMDSVTLLHYLNKEYEVPGKEILGVSFDYGQKHRKELAYAEINCLEIGAEWMLVDMSFLGQHLKSALTSRDQQVPEGHYADDNMRATVVPNRNAIMLSIATGIAVARQAYYVATGVHAGDHPVYPDCRPEFIDAMSHAMQLGNAGFAQPAFEIIAPFEYKTKTDIASLGSLHGVDWTKTWSCYKGGEHHCGKCGTCVERIEAFSLAGVVDPTIYQ